MLEIRLLGQFDVRLDGAPVEIPSRPAQSLLAYLILNAGIPHRREKLAGLLWPDATESNARSNLRHELWRLRKALDAGRPAGRDYLLADDLSITFDAKADYRLDVAVLEGKGSETGPADDLVEALSVYQGELLPGFYDDWVVPEREQLQAIFERQMTVLMDRLVAEAHWPEVLEWGERWVALGHAPEPAYRALMTAHSGRGDSSSVVGVYQRCVEALRRDLGVEPSAQTRSLYERLVAREQETRDDGGQALRGVVSPVLPRPLTRTHNLPAQLTSFIGRTKEMAEIKAVKQHFLAQPFFRVVLFLGKQHCICL